MKKIRLSHYTILLFVYMSLAHLTVIACREQHPILESGYSDQKRMPSVFRNSLGMRMVLVRSGKFLMGSPLSENNIFETRQFENQGWTKIEKPFYISTCEVTNEDYQIFIKETGYDGAMNRQTFLMHFHDPQYGGHFDPPQNPVVFVNWYDAMEFCKWLGNKEDRRYRLPTEKEWEYACRAGSEGRYRFGNDKTKLETYAWFSTKNVPNFPHSVGNKRANDWGIYDMHGNVWEWCLNEPPQKMIEEPFDVDVKHAIIRGGYYNSGASSLRCARRSFWPRDERVPSTGFRVVSEAKFSD